MSAFRIALRVAALVLLHVALTLAIGAVLLFGYAGWQLLIAGKLGL